MEGADQLLKKEGVMLHQLLDIREIAKMLQEQNLIDKEMLDRVQKQTAKA